MKRIDLFWLLTLLGIQLLFFPPAAFSPSHLLATRYSDVITQHLPHQMFIRDSFLRSGSFPLWNPLECSGTPAFPNPLYFTLALPHLILTPLPPPLALNLGFFIHILLAGVFTYAFARRIGCERPSALFAAIVFSLGARSLSHVQAGFYSRTIIFAYIPILFICAEKCLTDRSTSSSLLLALSLLLTLLSGELQLLLYTILFLIIYAILRLLIYPASFSDEHGSMGVAGCGRVRVSGNGGYPRGNSIVSSQTDTWLLRHSDTPTPPHSHTPTRRHGLLFLLLGFLLFPPLSAFYLLPALRLSPILSRSLPVGQGHYSFMPTLAHLALMLNPALLSDFSPGIAPPWESVLYIGLAPMLLILRASCDTHSRRDFLLWGTLLVLAVLCSLQELKHVHILFSRIFPMLGAFRNPARLLYLVPFFGAILSARALHHLSCSSPSPLQSRSPAPWMCIFVAGIILFICASGWLSRQSDEILMNNYKVRFSALFGKGQLNPLDARIVQQEAISFRRDGLLSLRWQLALLVSLCSLFLIMERRVAQPKIFMLLLVGITVADLLYFARHYLETHSMNELYPPSALQEKIRGENISARLLDTSAPFAAAFWTDLPFFATAARGISRIDGYSPVNLSAYVRYIDTMTGLTNPYARWSITVPRIMHPELLSLLNGELLLSELPLDQPQWELVGEFRNVPLYKQFLGGLTVPHIFLYRNNASLPRAWLVPEAEICQPGMEGKRLLTTDPRQRVLIPPGAMALTDGEPYRPIPITPRTPNLVELELETRLPSYVCTGEIWAPGWTASDNGVRCEVLKINMLFRGLFLSPGKHHIFLSYRPPGFRTGMAISALTLALMLAGVAGARARRKI